MSAKYTEPSAKAIGANDLATSVSNLNSGGSGSSTPSSTYGTKANPYPMTAGYWTEETTINTEHWMKCEIGGSLDLYVQSSGLLQAYVYVDSKTSTLTGFYATTKVSSIQRDKSGVHTYYLRFVPTESVKVKAMCAQHVDTCSDLTKREWQENSGSGYVSKEFQRKQFFLAEEVPSLVKALDMSILWDATVNYIAGEIDERRFKQYFIDNGILTPKLAGILGLVSTMDSILDAIGKARLLSAIGLANGNDNSIPIAVSFYQDDLATNYWTYEVERWDGKEMSGCPGARGTFVSMDYYWFE